MRATIATCCKAEISASPHVLNGKRFRLLYATVIVYATSSEMKEVMESPSTDLLRSIRII